MYKSILNVLMCPTCKEELTLSVSEECNDEIIEGTLCCVNNHEWSVREGIIDFNSKEQEFGNNWSDYYEKYDFDELDNIIDSKRPFVEQESNEVMIAHLITTLEKNNFKNILDIATGRGMLMKRLISHFGTNINLTCSDLSFEVLKYDRLKSLRVNPHVKINYIACDASNLPLRKNTFDSSVSFFGIANMGGLFEKGVSEALRVTDGPLFNCLYALKDDNPVIPQIDDELKAAGHDFSLTSVTESALFNSHKITGDTSVLINNVFEGIGEDNTTDLIPIKGEWFAGAIATVTQNK